MDLNKHQPPIKYPPPPNSKKPPVSYKLEIAKILDSSLFKLNTTFTLESNL